MKQRFTGLLIVLAFLFGGLCLGAPTPSHACCPDATTWQHPSKAPNTGAPCCIQQTVNTLGIDKQALKLLGDNDPITPNTLALPNWEMLLATTQQATLSKTFIKDQSHRYLELSVLLN